MWKLEKQKRKKPKNLQKKKKDEGKIRMEIYRREMPRKINHKQKITLR